jgi:hypothetical protein
MIDFVDLVRLEAELQRVYDEGYADGKRDAASPWYRVEEPPKYSGKVFVILNREGPFYDTELVADTAMYNCLPHGPVPVGTFYKGMFGKSDFEDITKNVLYWMPVELPKEKKI